MFAESLVGLIGLFSVHAANVRGGTVFTLNDLPVARYVPARASVPVKKDPDSLGVEVTARAAAVLDVGSGELLYEKDSESAYPVASLTKLITAMTFLDTKPDLSAETTVLPQDETPEARSPFLPNERLTKGGLLKALLVGSVNAAANALARSTSEHDAFIRAMNRKARTLGMHQAAFVDPVGLGSRNQASARDIAIALRAALTYPQIREATELDKVEIKGRLNGKSYQIKTTNLLLGSFLNKDPYRIVAGKTGSLPEAGFCLAQATRNQEGNEVIAVVLGSENHFARFQDTKALTAWAFGQFEWPKKQAQLNQ